MMADLDWQFVLNWGKIVLLDLTLAGDNAVVIAMAVHTLPSGQQRTGIVLGALGAVIVRVLLTFAASELLLVPAVQLVGGLLLVWIALKLLAQDSEDTPTVARGATLLQAVRVIVIADLIMSLDNILAIAGASDGSSFLVLFGLGLSIPIVIAGAAFVAALMNHCGWIVYLGAAILGEVAGKMIVEDDFVELTIGAASVRIEWLIRIALAALVVTVGIALARHSDEAPALSRDRE
jgi:YjbE family integral membrane protein